MAYSQVFSSCRQGAAPEVKLLINVILAAQEPLSNAMLEQLGMASWLPSLPGWGCLFYNADHRVYLLHKSLRSVWNLCEVQREHKFMSQRMLVTRATRLSILTHHLLQ